MGSKWPLIKLGDFVQIVTGHPFKSKDYSEVDGVKLLRGDNIAQGTLNWQNVKMLPDDKIGSKERNYYLRTGDVILAMDRPWIEAGLKTAQINENDLPCLLVQRVACLRCEDSSDQDFIRYIISSYSFVQYVKLIQTGTAVPHISGKQIKNFEFRLPPKNVRKVIGEVIKRLDDKAHINRQINQTLEQMAQALFKSWFVDFDPVVDNALDAGFFAEHSDLPEALLRRAEQRKIVRGQPDFTPLPAETRQLFPAAFEACEEPSLGLGGWVPQGWSGRSVSKAITVNPKVKLAKGEMAAFVDMKSLPVTGYSIEDVDRKAFSGGAKFKQHDVLFARITPCLQNGKTGFVDFLSDDESGFGSTEFIVLRGNEFVDCTYVACLSRDEKFRQHAMQSMVGSSGRQRVQNSCFDDYFIVIPPQNIMNKFAGIVSTSFKKLKTNSDEIISLANVRDTLLPKLISGELRLSDDGTLADGDTDC
ncbi:MULTISPECIES: restriction endonuclease subunit S [Edwardsiella]|uniref:Type I restriction-modification system, specificity subunit S n=2 Tax=Edwardsiella anguillarum TaxID=1821960 RepID=A0A076LUX6_9GAMM|nr:MULTISPECIES: restriction endonuclease subunit S [Edwardsiella]AIJ10482.1 Type I restriction-modification system, specificity subunit S [Edwardsiella anguillarum ET080813]AKR77970.1 restriction endonuclease subunit S [Edwardsiella sp. LADL05-105]MDA6077531.1 restriction endonuclease subunit S [Edwardsiella anguillarum]UOU77681.1 restriction endonuclease subunit S [Edwardsiella anguillarum]WHP82319.1 restriction endonuclease subunit S [Edwardsiella anguillarum]